MAHRNSLQKQCVPVSLRSLQSGTVNVEGRLIQRLMLLSSAVGQITIKSLEVKHVMPAGYGQYRILKYIWTGYQGSLKSICW